MDTVILDGIKYVKASELARQFKYTSDYIGQLCRGKKVDARLVGRTWFVNPDSLVDHRKSRHSKPSKDSEQTSLREADTNTRMVAVANNKVGKYTPREDTTISGTRKIKVSYEKDEEVLFPHISKKEVQPAKLIRIEQADAKKVKIGGKSKPYTFTSDELPEVALSGKIKVVPLPEAEELEQNEEKTKNSNKNIAISESRDNIEPHIKVRKLQSDKQESVSSEVNTGTKKVTKQDHINKKSSSDNSLRLGQIPPKNSKKSEIKFSPDSVSVAQPVKISNAVLLSPLIATVLAIVVVGVLFSASSKTVVSQENYQSDVVLQMANLFEILKP
ncbi:hypothetical protein H6781_00225 [Candidatus Nomurabacteria bacterium]|nr:hypothetical protein [Candidatus Kaiserbacteria bacterium]MCB9810008.1 hypothetical protein [Candidatus Nomurabacteria bacterium]